MNPNLHTIVSIADIHFGAIDPLYMYNALQEQFVNRIAPLKFDILAICGDLFDSKFMSNNPIVSYAISFIDNLVNLCRSKNATLVLLEGTQSHDNGQLKLFYHYLADPMVDVRIVEQVQFEMIQGLRVLCIPEKYGLTEEFYRKILFESGSYDLCLIHGTFRGSFVGTEIATLNSTKAPIFSMNSFINCMGPILMGHYHINGCYESYAYYHGSAFRYHFGEEAPKGFLVTLYDTWTRQHLTKLIEIESHKYVTININDLLNEDPKVIIDYIKHYQEANGIDFIRVQYDNATNSTDIAQQYFRTNASVTLQELNRKTRQLEKINNDIMLQNQQYSFILDNELDDYTKFVMYMNQHEGADFITVDELVSLLEKKV